MSAGPADFEQALAETAAAVDAALDALLPRAGGVEGRVAEAMRYATLNGGKRLRPFLVVAGAQLFEVSEPSALRTAAAVEMIHCYSLVHDDLPAMDDDDVRRGQPACHVAFDEATAILAGDALLTYAFEALSAPETHASAAVRCELVRGLAVAAGCGGMVGGQMIDLLAAESALDIDGVTRLQKLKTGALIAFACEAGAILGEAGAEARAALAGYGHDLGLAFQIADDLLDIEGSEAETGKAVGKDAAAGKATFVGLLGVDGARDRARVLVDRAVGRLARFGGRAARLEQIAHFVINRRR
ncbi:MAG: polyprenyl synthetase family protein [Proteobacteria bacterium]|nr:polyprenyl synthetase family protein [Pseudomonadota bacterium]